MKRLMTGKFVSVTLLLLAVVVLRLFFSKMTFTWSAILLCLAVLVFLCAATTKSKVWSYIGIVVFSVFTALFIGETWFSLERYSQERVVSVPLEKQGKDISGLVPYASNQGPDPVLGYAPKPQKVQASAKKMIGDKVLYDVIYSTLDSGWRVTPQNPDAKIAVLFFGCSFTIGEGLQDEESFPYRVGEMLGPSYQTFNFGLQGYGAHQMLAMIESGRLDEVLKGYDTVVAFFLTIANHEFRSAGQVDWDRHGPRYVLENEIPVRHGTFADVHSSIRKSFDRLFSRSSLYKKFNQPGRRSSPELVRLHTAIIEKSSRLMKEKYGASFAAILWPDAKHFEDDLLRRNIPVIDLDVSMPGYASDRAKYEISVLDLHPNAYSANLIAEIVTDYLKRNGLDF